MKEKEIIDLKGIRKFNLNIPEDSLDFLIYLCRERNSCELIDIVIHFCFVDLPNSHFYKTLSGKSESERYTSCLSLTRILQYWFIDNTSEFAFKDYFYNDSKSDLIKKSKINALLKNISASLFSISAQTGITQFKSLGRDSAIYFEKELSTKYKSTIILQQEYNASEYDIWPNGYLVSGHQKGLLYYFIGIILLEFYEKIIIEFSGFIDNESIIDIRKIIEGGVKTMEANSYGDIFKSLTTYNSFKEYSASHIVEPYIDYSYLFQRLLLEKLIHKKTHFQYMDWLSQEKLITPKTYNRMKVERNFRSLEKSSSSQRENNFNNIFKR